MKHMIIITITTIALFACTMTADARNPFVESAPTVDDGGGILSDLDPSQKKINDLEKTVEELNSKINELQAEKLNLTMEVQRVKNEQKKANRNLVGQINGMDIYVDKQNNVVMDNE